MLVSFASELYRLYTNAFYFFAGEGATNAAEEILHNYLFISAVIIGEVELTFMELCEAIENNKTIESIDGLYFKNHQHKIIKNKSRKLIDDLDDLEFYDYSDRADNLKQHPWAVHLTTSRGCDGGCAFCKRQ